VVGSSNVIACNKREAFVQGSEATRQSISPRKERMDCFADARNDVVRPRQQKRRTFRSAADVMQYVYVIESSLSFDAFS
jgi:hypothetical protein